MDSGDIESQHDRAIQINTERVVSKNRDDGEKTQRCKTGTIRVIKVVTALALICVIVILAVFWANGDTLLAKFSFQKENVRTPVFICIEVFLAVVVLVSLADILRMAFAWLRRQRKYTSLADNDIQFVTPMWKGIKALSSTFRMKQSLENLQIHALAEIGLLTKEACRVAAGARLQGRESQQAVHGDEYCITLSTGISVENGHALFTSNIVQVTALITGSINAGKTSIFNRIMYGGFSETKPDTIGFNFGLKTLTIDGPNMFNQREALNIEIQLVDFCLSQEQICEQLPFIFDNHSILIIVSDVMNRSSIESVAPLISQLRDKAVPIHASTFVNKVDEADNMPAIRSEYYHHLEGIDLFEVSAKTGEGVTESFIKAVSKAICVEARDVAQSKRL